MLVWGIGAQTHPRPRAILSSKFYITLTQLRNMEDVASRSRLVVIRVGFTPHVGYPTARALARSRFRSRG